MRRSSVCRTGVFFLALTCVQFAMLQNAAASSGRIIYSFAGGTDGAYPESDLILDAAGNLYGTTSEGGTSNCGTVFELARGQSGWKHQVLYSFNGGPGDGCGPQAGLVFDSAGNFYGTTSGGGAESSCFSSFGGCGTVFKLAPNSQGGWNESVLYSFGNSVGGNNPNTDLAFDSQGNLYGTTLYGGSTGCRGLFVYGCGTVFQLKPQPNGAWVESTIYQFAGGPNDGAAPISSVVLDIQGNITGVTEFGGTAPCNIGRSYQGCGAVYQLTPNSGGGWTETLLYSFHRYRGTAVFPSGGLILADGGLLGVSNAGGNGLGAVFELQQAEDGWDQIVRYRFFGDPDGTSPVGRLAGDSHGNFFGATTAGGPQPLGYGTVFELVPVKNRWNRWQERVLFNGDSTNGYPQAGPVVDSQGHLFGTFSDRYSSGSFGSVYEVIP